MGQFAHLYDATWRRLRAAHLSAEPLCRKCKERGIVRAATVVDHVVPHRGDLTLFRDPLNFASLCTSCHSSTKQREERGRPKLGADRSGWPEAWS